MKEMWPECGESRLVTREGAEEYGNLPEGGESTEGKRRGTLTGKEGFLVSRCFIIGIVFFPRHL